MRKKCNRKNFVLNITETYNFLNILLLVQNLQIATVMILITYMGLLIIIFNQLLSLISQ